MPKTLKVLFVLSCLVLAVVAGFQARPLLVQRDGLRINGWLTAVGFSNCANGLERGQALAMYWMERSFASKFIEPVWASSLPKNSCRILGVRSLHNLIVNSGENYLVDSFQNTTEPENLKYHAIGTGVVAAAETDTGLGTEWVGGDYSGGVRANCTPGEGSGTNVYRCQATNTKASVGTSAITEWGLLSSATVGAGTLWSRVTFAAINLSQNDSLQTTYDLTVE